MKFTTISFIRDEKSIVEWCSLVMAEGTKNNEDQSLGYAIYIDVFGKWSM
jgi:hypothetical protein